MLRIRIHIPIRKPGAMQPTLLDDCTLVPMDGYEHISSCPNFQRGTILAGNYILNIYVGGALQNAAGNHGFVVTHVQQTTTALISTVTVTLSLSNLSCTSLLTYYSFIES
jgi:hypothetical protein